MLIEVTEGILKGLWFSRSHLFRSFVVVPAGLLAILTILYGLNRFLVSGKVLFPCLILGFLINLIILCVLDGEASLWSSPKHRRTWNGRVSGSFGLLLEH